MRTDRLEAFSDGVLAIVITIMVLELDAPEEATFDALIDATGVGFLGYLLSFVYLGIYWNNHHHVFQLVDRVSAGVLWSNLHLLFWLSLLPFTTGWIAESDLAQLATVVYGLNLLLAGLACWLMEQAILRLPGEGEKYREAVGADRKAAISTVLYLAAIVVAFWSPGGRGHWLRGVCGDVAGAGSSHRDRPRRIVGATHDAMIVASGVGWGE